MPHKNKLNKMTILAIFRAADPVRQILRDYAAGTGWFWACYNDIFDALSRMPMIDNPHNTIIIARPETFSPDAVAAMDSLLNPNTAHYVLWLDNSHGVLSRQWPLLRPNIHSASNRSQFETLIKTIAPAAQNSPTPDSRPETGRTRFTLQIDPLTNAERDALLGAGL